MRGLFLYGANCTLEIWDNIKDELENMNCDFLEYPHEITMHATGVEDITKWVYHKIRDERYDFIVGHSMGGIVALELVANYKVLCKKLIFIESNLRPANEFYRNLMMPSNMELLGEKVMSMIKSEAPYYSDNLSKSLQTEFDYSDYVRNITCEVYGIYGDRGEKTYSKRIEDLCLDNEINKKIIYRFVEDSCHMPMIENPNALIEIIKECLENRYDKELSNDHLRCEFDAEELRKLLIKEGASIVAYADLSQFAEGNLKHGISIAMKIPAEVIKGIENGPTRAYYNSYNELNNIGNQLALLAEDYIKGKGYQAKAQTTDAVKEYGDYRTSMPHKTVATNAGIGWIGKSALLVTKEYGSAIRLTSVLTDAPLPYGIPIKESLCGSCMKCVLACPGQAVSGMNWNESVDRDELFDPIKCRKQARKLAFERIKEEITLCGKCVQVCPYTNRYLQEYKAI